MFALVIVAIFFLPFGDSKEPHVYDYWKSIFGWTNDDHDLIAYAVNYHGGKASDYLAYNTKLTRKMNAAYDIWTHLSPESKKFVQDFNEVLFEEEEVWSKTLKRKSSFHKLKPFVESLSKKARDELCEIYKGFAAFLKEFGKKCDI
ncbi:unnamed protein product [Cylicocyclus nassatus]|uniref:Uncharacterized protein n=1 Tax=Cylicocyclus nassatus TaxID=53992 RepID=A0AA36GSV1_CYLNA|nr:unnamed protein product [Cylicocyclus nassatus]